MPTGYTAGIEDGKITTGKDFLMRCARNFGACIEMKDEPLSTPIPQAFEPAGFYKDWIAEEEKNLEMYLSLTVDDARRVIDKEYERKQKQNTEAIEREKKIRQKYESVREEVERWNPPTPEHNSLKNFALEQISISCEPRDTIGFWEAEMRELKVPPEEWLKTKIEHARESLERYKRSWREEVERTERRNKWLNDLRESLAKI